MQKNLLLKSHALTLIELLAAVLVLTVVMAVSIPLYLSAISDSHTKSCRANMQVISIAVMSAKNIHRTVNAGGNGLYYSNYGAYFGTVDTALETDLVSIPVCPDNGNYTIVAVTSPTNFAVACSNSRHGTFEPGKNSR